VCLNFFNKLKKSKCHTNVCARFDYIFVQRFEKKTMSYEPVPLGGDYDGGGSKGHPKRTGGCCSPSAVDKWTLFFVIVIAGIFTGFMLGLFLSREDLQATSKATVAMHDETMETKETITKALKEFRSKFPDNQEELTVGQVLDSIDKAHAMMAWAETITKQVPTNDVQTIVRNVDKLVGNVTVFVQMITAVFTPAPDTMAKGKRDQTDRMLESARGLMFRSVELLSALKPSNISDMFASVKRSVDSVNAIASHIKGETVSKILANTAEILASAESEHVVDVISRISKGALDIIDRFKQSEGIRISLPLDHPAAAALPAPVIVHKKTA